MKKIISLQWANGLIFVIAMWLLSRVVIVVAMQLIAPLLNSSPPEYAVGQLGFIPNFVPKIGWELFSHWDEDCHLRLRLCK